MFKSGFVTIIGMPNVGKSSLLNTIIKEKLSIVSPKPQTTRNNIIGILNSDKFQIIFTDTPGRIQPKSKLDEFMHKSIKQSLDGIDIILYVLDSSKPFKESELNFIESYAKPGHKVILVVNKIDLMNFEKLYPKLDLLNKLNGITDIIPISTKTNKNIDKLMVSIINNLDEGIKYYDTDKYTDKTERFIASEIIREKALWNIQQEIPHGIAVYIERFVDKKDKKVIEIDAVLICEKKSHKNIIIGSSGLMLKKIGKSSRLDIEKLINKKVHLNIWVKVKENWRDKSNEINMLGYNKDSI